MSSWQFTTSFVSLLSIPFLKLCILLSQEQICLSQFTYAMYGTYFWGIFEMYVHVCAICMSLVSTMWPEILYTHFANYISCYWHILLHKYGCHITNKGHTALILDGHLYLTMVHICTHGESTTSTSNVIVCMCKKKSVTLHTCQMSHPLCISVYVSYVQSPASAMWPQALITFFVNYISCPWHISLNTDIG